VWEAIAELDAPTKHEIATEVNLAARTVRDYIEVIQDRGYAVSADSHHRYHLPDEAETEDAVDGGFEWVGDRDTDDAVADGGDEDGGNDTDENGDEDADGDGIPDLSEPEHRAIRELPATVTELANALNETDPHAALELLREDGINIGYDNGSGKYYIADERSEQLRSQTHLSLSAKTKHAKQALREEQAILDRLPDTTPLSIDDWEPDPNKETMVAAIGDMHFGDVVHDDRGREVYNREIAHEAADRFAEKVVQNKRQWSAEFDECVLCVLGDVATGTQIYDTQKHDIADLLAQQITDGAQALTRVATTLREHFDTLRIAAIVGNHGFQDPSAARGSNTDLTCYYWVQDALRREGYDNVEIMLAEHTHHLNIEVRGWRLHMRHGQDTQQHVDETARSQADWRGWRDKHKYDMGLRAHHHVPSLHFVLNRYPVVTIPSSKPGGEFADRIGSPDASTPIERESERKLGYCFGVSNDRRLTDSRMTDAG
jgi:hypothetical protein